MRVLGFSTIEIQDATSTEGLKWTCDRHESWKQKQADNNDKCVYPSFIGNKGSIMIQCCSYQRTAK